MSRSPYKISRHLEAARNLRRAVTRYIDNRASLNAIEDALIALRACAPVAGESGHRKDDRK